MTTLMPAAEPRGQAADACLSHGSGAQPLDRWELLSLVTDLRQELSLSDRDIMVLRAHLTVLPHGPLRPDGLNVSFMQVSEIISRACGMEERRFRRGEARLEACGLVHRRLSGNGRRFPERDREGRIVSAYGIDLSPLLARHNELQAMRSRREEEQLALRRRKNSVSARLGNAVRALTASGRCLPPWLEGLRERWRRVARRKMITLEELEQIEGEIIPIDRIEPGDPAPLPPISAPAITVAPPTDPAEDDGQSVRHIESEPKEKALTPHTRFDRRRIAQAWSRAATIKEFYPEAPESEREAAEVLFEFSSFLGLRQTGIIRGISTIGWEDMVIVVDYLSAKISTIKKPEGYLMSMIRSYEQGCAIAGGMVAPPRTRMTPAPG